MKAIILIAVGLLSSGAIAQSTMTSGQTTGSVTHDVKTTTVRHTGTVTHNKVMMHRHMAMNHHMMRHHGCTMRMRHGHNVRVCKNHMMAPMHHHMAMHKKVTIETKTKM